jgi:hypothetical protein
MANKIGFSKADLLNVVNNEIKKRVNVEVHVHLYVRTGRRKKVRYEKSDGKKGNKRKQRRK